MEKPWELPGEDKKILANGDRLKDVVRMYRTLRFLSKFLKRVKSMVDRSIMEIDLKYKIEAPHDNKTS